MRMQRLSDAYFRNTMLKIAYKTYFRNKMQTSKTLKGLVKPANRQPEKRPKITTIALPLYLESGRRGHRRRAPSKVDLLTDTTVTCTA